MYILLPVLQEVGILEDTIDYFYTHFLKNRTDIRLIIITTEKENTLELLRPNSIDLSVDLARRYYNVTHVHFPGKIGKMAHQLNYVVKSMGLNGRDILAVYNADSRPEAETFEWVRNALSADNSSVFQQYGCYIGNVATLTSSSVLASGSFWQTRWTVGFEIYNALKQLKYQKNKHIFKIDYPLNYCIGHGLFMTKEVLDSLGGFKEGVHNEDAIIGLQLSDAQNLIMPIPYFDISDSPDTISMLYKQKSNWYFGPLQAFTYMKYIIKNSHYGGFRRLRLFILSTKLFSHAIFWIAGPTFMLVGLIIALMNWEPWLISLNVSGIMLFAIPSIKALHVIKSLNVPGVSVDMDKVKRSLLRGFVVCYILHGASAYRGLYKYILQILSGKDALKEKTIINNNSF